MRLYKDNLSLTPLNLMTFCLSKGSAIFTLSTKFSIRVFYESKKVFYFCPIMNLPDCCFFLLNKNSTSPTWMSTRTMIINCSNNNVSYNAQRSQDRKCRIMGLLWSTFKIIKVGPEQWSRAVRHLPCQR